MEYKIQKKNYCKIIHKIVGNHASVAQLIHNMDAKSSTGHAYIIISSALHWFQNSKAWFSLMLQDKHTVQIKKPINLLFIIKFCYGKKINNQQQVISFHFCFHLFVPPNQSWCI